jgi:hypothetical protein
MHSPFAYRTEPDADARNLYENVAFQVTSDSRGAMAHTVVHGSLLGTVVSARLGTGATLEELFGPGGLLRVPAPDDGV